MNCLDPTNLDQQDEELLEEQAFNDRMRLSETLDFKWVMSDSRGRRFMWRLLESAGVYRTPFTGNREETDFRCGEQNIGLRYLSKVQAECPDLYAKMMKEVQEDERENRNSG